MKLDRAVTIAKESQTDTAIIHIKDTVKSIGIQDKAGRIHPILDALIECRCSVRFTSITYVSDKPIPSSIRTLLDHYSITNITIINL